MQITINHKLINSVCLEEDIIYLGLFGSNARGDAKQSSDVDILVDFNNTKSFFQLAKVQEKFEKIFEKKVDLVLKTAVKDSLKPFIARDLVTLYEKK